jgi:hypothetical protein
MLSQSSAHFLLDRLHGNSCLSINYDITTELATIRSELGRHPKRFGKKPTTLQRNCSFPELERCRNEALKRIGYERVVVSFEQFGATRGELHCRVPQIS